MDIYIERMREGEIKMERERKIVGGRMHVGMVL